jgi:hypothetical protein
MSLFKEEMAELLKVRKTLDSIGYAVCNIERSIGRGSVCINAVICYPGQHHEHICDDEALLRSLPDGITLGDYNAARVERLNARRRQDSL